MQLKKFGGGGGGIYKNEYFKTKKYFTNLKKFLLLFCLVLVATLSCQKDYTCKNGTAKSGKTADGGEKCESCNAGFVLENETCRQAIYTCSKGTVASGNPTTGNSDVENCTRNAIVDTRLFRLIILVSNNTM